MAREYNGSHMHTQTVTVEGRICTEDGSLSNNGFSGSPWVLFWMNCFKSYRNITNNKRRSLALEGRRRFCMETTCVTKRTNSLTPPSLSYVGASQRRRHWLTASGRLRKRHVTEYAAAKSHSRMSRPYSVERNA